MNSRMWTLLAIAEAGSGGLSPVQIQKALFLLGKEMPAELLGDNFYEFGPYNYGPFCRDVYADAERLAASGLVLIGTSSGHRHFNITPDGLGKAKDLDPPKEAYAYLTQVVKWAQAQTFAGLVRAIYNKYPEYRENSIFAG